MKTTLFPLLLILILPFSQLFAQSVGINTPTPNPSAALDITSADKGLLIPRMTTNQRDAINDPAQGLLVFVTNDSSFYFFNGDLWLPLSRVIQGGGGGNAYLPGTGIAINGNIINNAAPDVPVTLTGEGATTITGTYPNFSISSTDNVEDADSDPNNELQQLEVINNNTLRISGGNEVLLPTGEGGTTYAPGTGIAINGNTIDNTAPDIPVNLTGEGATTITGTYPNFNISSTDNVDDADNDPNNELQQLEVVNNTLRISGGNEVLLPTGEGGTTYVPGTGIAINGNLIDNTAPDIPVNLTGEGATTVTGTYPNFSISSTDNVDDADSDPNNEIQRLEVINDTLRISGGNEIVLPGGGETLWKENGNKIYYDVDNVGIMVDTPQAALHLASDQNLLIGDGYTGQGFKMIYYGAKGAFRCGYLNAPFGGYNYDNFWNYDSVGFYSFAAGQNSRAKGFGAFAFGSFGWADGSGSVAFFGSARGNNSFTFGGSSKGRGSITFEGTADEEGGIAMYGYTGGRYGVSIGGGTTGLGASSSREDYAIAIGWNSDARGQASIALGPSDAYGYNSFSTGWVTEARGNYSSTFGYQTNSYPYASMALGRFNVIEGDSAAWRNNDPIFMIGDGTSNANRSNAFTVLKSGRTSIGYNTPTGMLQVSSTLGSVNNGGALDPTRATLLLGTPATGMAFDANQIETMGSDLYLNFNSTDNLRVVEGGGLVGIGRDPGSRLDIEQSADAHTGGIRLNSNTANDFWAIFYDPNRNLTFNWEGVDKARINQADGAYVQLSDRRLKHNIRDLSPVLNRVLQLRPRTYFYENDVDKTTPSLGLIAQEVEAIFPEWVFQQGDYKALSYDHFSILAIKAVQEQQAQIDALRQENEQLKAQLAESVSQEDWRQLVQQVQRLEASLTPTQSK